MCSTYAAGAYAHLEPGSLMYTYIGNDPDKCTPQRESAAGRTSSFRTAQSTCESIIQREHTRKCARNVNLYYAV